MTTELNPADIRWRVSNTWDKGPVKWGMLVGYIDARTCMEALDSLDENWSAVHGDPIVVGNDLIGVPLSLTVNGVTRSDVGMPSSQEPIKGAYSDALKRAAVHFGIGRELYELPKIAVECEVYERTGKVKAPKALPVYRKGRWDIDRKVGWVKYDREPDEQPESSERAASTGKREAPAMTSTPVPSRYRRGELQELMAAHNLDNDAVEVYATAAGIPRDERPMSDESMDKLIDAIRESVAIEPVEVVPSPAGESSASGDTPLSPDAAPPKGRTVEQAIADANDKAAKAKKSELVQESLLGEPVA